MLGLILSSVIKERTFLKVLWSVIGLKLFGGPLGLPGFGMAIRTPELMSSSSWFVNVLFNMFAICLRFVLPILIGINRHWRYPTPAKIGVISHAHRPQPVYAIINRSFHNHA